MKTLRIVCTQIKAPSQKRLEAMKQKYKPDSPRAPVAYRCPELVGQWYFEIGSYDSCCGLGMFFIEHQSNADRFNPKGYYRSEAAARMAGEKILPAIQKEAEEKERKYKERMARKRKARA